VAEPIGGAISIFLGNGDGTFRAAPTIGADFPAAVRSADFNGDGIQDIVVVTGLTSSVVSVFLGAGDGTFGPEMDFPAEAAGALTVGDFNGDGLIDIVVGAYLDNEVITLLNTGAASFSPTTPLTFKKQAIGTKSAAQKVTLTNTGKTPLTISAMKVAGQFGMSSTCGKGVAAGKSCTISVTFSPQSQGAKSGAVTINDSASSKPMVIELSGTGS
jgi:Abnormal spindle-like microcephaly-assoc'd, ASPM-SPD-2-Hydin/FG-GAP-like repeat